MMNFAISVRFLEFVVALLLGANACAVAQTASDAKQTIAAGYKVAGVVVSKADGHPLARARILLRDVKDPQKFQSLVTSEDGKFEFAGLPAGKYSLEGSKSGFVSSFYDEHDQFSTAIATGASLDTENLVLRLAPEAVITGKILDETGEPIQRATVTLYYDDHSAGSGEIHQVRSAQTDDQGIYEISPVKPGTYFLSASATPWYAVHPGSEVERQAAAAGTFDRSLDVAYPLTYYADVSDSDTATPIPVGGAERVEVDVHLAPVPAIRVLFHVPDNGPKTVMFPQLQQSAFDGTTAVRASGGNVVAPGILEVTGIPAGRYSVNFHGPGSGLRMNGIDLTKDGAEVDTSNAETLSSVKVLVRAPGESALPSGLTIGLRSGKSGTWQAVDSKGATEFQQVAAGRYEVALRGAPSSYSIAHISAKGAQVSGHAVTIGTEPSPSVLLTLQIGSIDIQGTVKREGKPFAGAMVILIPKNAETNPDLFRRDQSALDGSFSLRGVVPGSYIILAFENGWDLDWSQPKVIAAYVKHGQMIEANPTVRSINLSEAIEVQGKY